MDTDAKDACTTNGCKTEATLDTGDSQKVEENVNGDEDSESNSLLPPRRGGMSRKSNKTRRKVQWNDRNGNNLVEVLEFEPRENGHLHVGLLWTWGPSCLPYASQALY
ncbi:uncharacterized protein LOC125472747 isoform X1 [Pyrus x bretschneideri]|uniref:uncharacterized protein LOC125472747 isoform X1 n=1 Tax=Pyrus x bretschneideri TaxID=225117 RepID=UPI00202EE0A5|nr:uncharacterized protein LOC125472747 isoform X1 [Pyrus x bretschneideri]